MSKIGVVGVGYVGLTQAVGMSQLDHSVVAYDIDASKIEKLKNGKSPFFEPGLEDALANNLQNKAILFSAENKDLQNCEFIFLCLPTPQGEDGSADTSYLISAVKNIAPVLNKDSYLIIKSTVPVNSWKKVQQEIERQDLNVVSNPEFLREGSALKDFHHPDRIVIGATSLNIAENVASLYEQIETTFVLTDNTSAELIKYAANSFLAIKLSFVNDIAALCENLGANSKEVLHGVGLDKRIGDKFLKPGPGWGGSCFPKDVRALANIADSERVMMPLLGAAIESNESAHERVVKKIEDHFGDLSTINIGVLGLAFKANTDDTRNSPAIEIIKKLQDRKASILAYDPAVTFYEGIQVAADVTEVFANADLLLILTEWPEFLSLNLENHLILMRKRNVLDTRNIFDPQRLVSLGFKLIK